MGTKTHFAGYLSTGGNLTIGESDVPFASIGKRAVFRGYIANASSVRSMLDNNCKGELSDAELICRAAEQWRGDLSRHVLGEYAAVVYLPDAKQLLITHDTLGIANLFYHSTRDRIYFATFLEGLLRWVSPLQLDDEYIADHLGGNQEVGRRTPYDGVFRLLPGESLSWVAGRLSRHRAWPFAERRQTRLQSSADYEDTMRLLIAEGVDAAIPSKGPVWCELSGGLDSTTVLAYAARQNAGRVTACSTIYPQSTVADERSWIEHALRYYAVPWHALDGDSRLPFDRPSIGFVAEPNDRMITQGMLELYDQALLRGGVEVVLTGQGGDAVFLGDGAGPVYLADMIREGRLRALARAVSGLVKESPDKRSSQYWLTRYALAPILRSWRGQVLDSYFHRSPPPVWLREDYVDRQRVRWRRRRQHVLRAATLGGTAILERISAVVAGFTRHNNHPSPAAEFRHPLLYRPLVEFMLNVPGELASSPVIDRALQRRALAGILPEPVRTRRGKAGRGQIFYTGLERSAFWQNRLTDLPMIVELGYVNGDRWRAAIRAAAVGHSPGIGSLLAAICLEAWLQQFMVGVNGQLGLSSRSPWPLPPV